MVLHGDYEGEGILGVAMLALPGMSIQLTSLLVAEARGNHPISR